MYVATVTVMLLAVCIFHCLYYTGSGSATVASIGEELGNELATMIRFT